MTPEPKTIVVTGASSGIGRALTVRALHAGFSVGAVARDERKLNELEQKGIVMLAIDVGEPGAARAIVERARSAFGRIDVLVNNAGFASAGALVAQSDDALRRQFATHAIGPIALVREALPFLQASRGHVIMVGSGVARVPVDGLGAYPASKAALRSATATLRRELRPLGIAVTYVDPGVVDTPFMPRAGLSGAPRLLRLSPERVARTILQAIARRQREANAAPWQTTAVAIAERFPRLTDAVLSQATKVIGTEKVGPPSTGHPERSAEGAKSKDSDNASDERPTNALDNVLEPFTRRMERSGLRLAFVRDLLVPLARLELGEVAMRWAGMPNKHERALTLEVLRALEAAGYLEPAGSDAWTVSEKRATTS